MLLKKRDRKTKLDRPTRTRRWD